MKKLGMFESILSILIIGLITTMLYLYTSGFRLKKNEDNVIDINKTGMVSAKSIPTSASVYIDDELRTATDDTVAGLEPGVHTLKISKNGYVTWEKNIEIFEQMVTDITAVMIAQSPRIEPLTYTGASNPKISNSLNKLAFFSSDAEEPGIWVMPLGGTAFSLFRSTGVLIQDTPYVKYSEGQEITWSPDESELLVKRNDTSYYLVDIEAKTAETTTTPDLILEKWGEELLEVRAAFLANTTAPEATLAIAKDPDTRWAPDQKKILYVNQVGDSLEYRVYNFENPLPIGEKRDNLVFTTKVQDAQPKVSWYADSFHLILAELDQTNENRGTISLVRIDGTNKTEVYNNTLYSDYVVSNPGGDKVIVLTSFKSNAQTDLYTISIR